MAKKVRFIFPYRQKMLHGHKGIFSDELAKTLDVTIANFNYRLKDLEAAGDETLKHARKFPILSKKSGEETSRFRWLFTEAEALTICSEYRTKNAKNYIESTMKRKNNQELKEQYERPREILTPILVRDKDPNLESTINAARSSLDQLAEFMKVSEILGFDMEEARIRAIEAVRIRTGVDYGALVGISKTKDHHVHSLRQSASTDLAPVYEKLSKQISKQRKEHLRNLRNGMFAYFSDQTIAGKVDITVEVVNTKLEDAGYQRRSSRGWEPTDKAREDKVVKTSRNGSPAWRLSKLEDVIKT